MPLSFGHELRATGLAGPHDPVQEVHRIDGPITITGCLRIGDRLAWIEHDRDQRLAASGVERALAAIRTVAGNDSWALVPVVSERGTAVFCDVVGERVLVDLLLPGKALHGDARPALIAVFERLGDVLGQLHQRRAGGHTVRALLRRHPRIEELARLLDRRRTAPQPTLALERLQEAVLCDTPVLAGTLIERCELWERCPGRSILHGTFCPGYVAVPDGPPDPRRLQLLGWYDSALGPPAFDAGWLLGELRELAEARAGDDPAGCEVLRECGRRFLGAYLDRRPTVSAAAFVLECEQFAAMKIVSHLVAFVRGYGFDRDAVTAQLALARRVLAGGWEPPL